MNQPDKQPSVDASRRSGINRTVSKFIAVGLLCGASRVPHGWWMLLYFFWLFVILVGIVIIHSNASSARRLRLDRCLMDADQPPTHTNEFAERVLAGRKTKPPLMNLVLLFGALAATSSALALLLDSSDVLLVLSLLSSAVLVTAAGSFGFKRSALTQFKSANASSGSRKIAAIREKHAHFEASLSNANAGLVEREKLNARVSILRRDGLVGGERLRDSFDL